MLYYTSANKVSFDVESVLRQLSTKLSMHDPSYSNIQLIVICNGNE